MLTLRRKFKQTWATWDSAYAPTQLLYYFKIQNIACVTTLLIWIFFSSGKRFHIEFDNYQQWIVYTSSYVYFNINQDSLVADAAFTGSLRYKGK